MQQPVQAAAPPPQRRPSYWINLLLFLVTLLSVLVAGNQEVLFGDEAFTFANVWKGWTFAVPLMAILLAHEFGHYIAARIHRVHASLPYFIPMPISPFGTMGAIIAMRGRIGSRRALLDIGASGPLAGMVVALPIVVWGLRISPVQEITGHGLLEGQCLLYSLLKWISVGPIPEGSDVFLHPTAFAGWVGLLITMINLVPVGQLDGGHVAYALLGPRQNKIAKVVHFSLLGVFAVNFLYHIIMRFGSEPLAETLGVAFEMSMFWLVWFGFLFLLRRFSGGDHPPTEPGELGRGRKLIAIGTLFLFVLLFIPTPLSRY
jgi:membrane-associated protease RseP (regulator of RpoE activity)